MARTITRKISLSGAKLADILKNNGKLFIGRVVGVATGTKENVHPQYGVSVGLVGAFRSITVDKATGEQVSIDAPVVWGPGVLIEPVVSALKAGSTSVNVGPVDLYAVTSETSPVGYMYVLESHGNDDADPLTAMLATMPVLPVLAAPKKSAK